MAPEVLLGAQGRFTMRLQRRLTYFAVLLILSLLAVGGLFATALSQAEPVEEGHSGGTLVYSQSEGAVFLDPINNRGPRDAQVYTQILEPLLRRNPDTLELEPGLVESWDVSTDGRTITLTVREGVKFQNGQGLTAEDVAFSIQRLQDPTTQLIGFVEWIDQIQVLDAHHVLLTTSTPALNNLLKLNEIYVVPESVYLALGRDEFNRHPVGTGPFMLDEWVVDEYISLVKNPDYWLKEPFLDKLIFRPIPELAVAALELKTGGVQITDNLLPEDVEALRSTDGIEVLQKATPMYFYVGFNYLKKPFDNLSFRQAVAMSFDMDDAIEKVFGGVTAARISSAIPAAGSLSDTDYLQDYVALNEDDVKAKELFSLLKRDGIIPDNFSVTINTPLDTNRRRLATIIATNLLENGIEARVEPLAWSTYDAIIMNREAGKPKDLDMYIIGCSAPDAVMLMKNVFYSSGERLTGLTNYSDYMNPQVDLLIDRALYTLNQQEQDELLKVVQRIALEDYVHLPAYTTLTTHGVSTIVHNFKASPFSRDLLICSPWNNVWMEH